MRRARPAVAGCPGAGGESCSGHNGRSNPARGPEGVAAPPSRPLPRPSPLIVLPGSFFAPRVLRVALTMLFSPAVSRRSSSRGAPHSACMLRILIPPRRMRSYKAFEVHGGRAGGGQRQWNEGKRVSVNCSPNRLGERGIHRWRSLLVAIQFHFGSASASSISPLHWKSILLSKRVLFNWL